MFWQIMVPIGFQLLAMLGGKALLLSKMALLLASINGLKRVTARNTILFQQPLWILILFRLQVASSGVHYGLYHADPHVHIPWDRNEAAFNRPRAFPSHRSERVWKRRRVRGHRHRYINNAHLACGVIVRPTA